MLDFEHARHRMVEAHIARRGVHDERVLQALRYVPREAFVDAGFEEFAYEDSPLPIGNGQTISQPFVVAKMTEAAEIEETDRVLEVGTGSGYAAAVHGRLAAEVFSVERHRSLAEQAEERSRLRIRKVEVRVGDGTRGWPEARRSMRSSSQPVAHRCRWPSQEQLDIGGRLVMPVGREPRRSGSSASRGRRRRGSRRRTSAASCSCR